MQVLKLLDSLASDTQHPLTYSALKIIIIKVMLTHGKH